MPSIKANLKQAFKIQIFRIGNILNENNTKDKEKLVVEKKIANENKMAVKQNKKRMETRWQMKHDNVQNKVDGKKQE